MTAISPYSYLSTRLTRLTCRPPLRAVSSSSLPVTSRTFPTGSRQTTRDRGMRPCVILSNPTCPMLRSLDLSDLESVSQAKCSLPAIVFIADPSPCTNTQAPSRRSPSSRACGGPPGLRAKCRPCRPRLPTTTSSRLRPLESSTASTTQPTCTRSRATLAALRPCPNCGARTACSSRSCIASRRRLRATTACSDRSSRTRRRRWSRLRFGRRSLGVACSATCTSSGEENRAPSLSLEIEALTF